MHIKYYGLFVVLALSAGCASNYETIYHYSPPVSERGQQCVAQCDQANDSCQRLCYGASCQADAKEQAQTAYDEYTAQQQMDGLSVTRNLASFYDTRQCKALASCQCEPEYRACYQLCGGQVSASGRQKAT